MRICFDMDGTLVNLYGVEKWLEMLNHYDETPYKKATALVNAETLAKLLNKLQRRGWQIGIISWLSKNSNPDYDTKVTKAKKKWLKKHLKNVHFDFIQIVPYGTCKNICFTNVNDILFDDEINNRIEWNGKAYDVHNIIEVLMSLF